MNKKVIAMVMVGGRGTRLENITKTTAKPAVSFGGKYKLIDFVLSNLSNSNIDTTGIITQYEPHELMSYIGHGSTWDLDSAEGGISFLTPYTSSNGEVWQKGTAHAIKQHFRYIDQYNPEYVVILSGDHIYKMDYNLLIEAHKKQEAEITISAFDTGKDASRFGIIEADSEGLVLGFEEKPEVPKSTLASMGIYVFNREILRELLMDYANDNFDFGQDIIPLALKKNKRVIMYHFNGYFRDVGTVDSLYKANMELLDSPQFLKLHEYVDFPVYTKSSNLPPHHIGKKCLIHNCMISDGCLILGDIYHSILSSNVVVENGSLIKDSILLQHVHVEEGVNISKAFILESTRIPAFTELVFDEITIIDAEYIAKLGDSHE